MLSVTEAHQQLLAAAKPLSQSQKLPLREALNRVLTQPVVAETDAPAFDNSAMDGYALCLGDLPENGELPLVGRSAAGQAPGLLKSKTAMRIFTGAPVPQGADSVCMQENCERFEREGQSWVRIVQPPTLGANIRCQSEDFTCGQELIAAGTRLQPQHLGLCSAAGYSHVTLSRPLRVAIYSSGNELIEPGQALQPGQIYNSNQVMLEALVQKLGCKLVSSATLLDDPEVIHAALSKTAAQCDLILTSGGVSVGEEDHLKAVVQSLGKLDLWRIAIKPGKPLAFGSIGDCGYMGLPGNPVSSFVTFCLFAAPYIRKRQGESNVLPQPVKAKALNAAAEGSREEYLRGKLTDAGVEIFTQQGSHLLTGLSQADCLVHRSANTSIQAGDTVEFFPLNTLLS